MSTPTGDTSNTAEAGSTIGIQASVVHNSTVYIVGPDDPPEKKFEIGVRYLDGGVPGEARKLIDDAIARGYDNAKVRFHLVLALLSKRSCSDLDRLEQHRLDELPQILDRYADDDWKLALSVASALVDQARGVEVQQPEALDGLDDLPSAQRLLIVRHFDLVLSNVMKDRLWSETRDAAQLGQLSNDRLDRIWAFFQPVPTPPREAAVPRRWEDDQVEHPWWWSAASLMIGGCLIWALVTTAAWTPAILLTLALALGSTATLTGRERRFRHLLRAADPTRFRSRRPPDSGFETRVRADIEFYSHKYAPEAEARRRWLTDSAPIRAALWEELVETYGDRGASADGLRWLVRYLVLQTRDDWKAGRLYAHRAQHRESRTIRCAWVISLVGAGLLTVVTAQSMFRASPLLGALLVVTAACAARTGISWVHVGGEKSFLANESRRRTADLEKRKTAYARWQKRLTETCPSDTEMERWLDCDKTLILAEALKVYRLAWPTVIAYAFLQTPGDSPDRARVARGPTRYSQYSIRLFLITKEGVREYATTLRFREARWEVRERNNFRFDAISSVRVLETGSQQPRLDITLTNGPSREIQVRDATPATAEEDPAVAKQVDLDEAGFSHALHVLEGIAAEGKVWLAQRRRGA